MRIRSALPPHPDLELERCQACGSAFFADFEVPAYEDAWGGEAALAFYQEQGAGVDVMLASLYAVSHDKTKRFLEIGCGFGFSVDFAARILSWDARGIDPGPAARLGRDLLGANIDDAYLSAEVAPGTKVSDLMLCSEVIEHIEDPDPFLNTLAANLAQDGTILFTTPNADAIVPETSPATLAPLLSPGYHVIIYSPKGLRIALKRNGFDAIEVADWGHSLRAAAARGSVRADFSAPLDRTAYRRYLDLVAARAKQASPLSLGMYGRLLKERVNAGEYEAAAATLEPIRTALRERWGLDLDAPETMPLDGSMPGSLEDLHRIHPFNLATLLYMTGMLFLVRDERQKAFAAFTAAAKAADRVRTVLRAIGSDDGETEELGWRSRAAMVRLAAKRDPDGAAPALERFASEARPPLNERPPLRIVDDLRRDVFVLMVNDGRHMAADRLAAAVEKAGLPENSAGVSTGFALGLLELNHRNSPKRAMQHFEQARARQERLASAPYSSRSFVWALRFHEGLAALKAREREHGREALDPLLQATAAYGEADAAYAERARTLARDHGLIRRGH
ncbi:class I SAM-dependent methyltransferase [Jiella sp. M17.18]|uniref:class I SAM-dependent methyltransferase n=1 Tax=Jiella sp. M17.18 TaxID=3234247 RepID=UPI0034E0445A